MGEFGPRRFGNDRARLLIGALLRPPAPSPWLIYRVATFTHLVRLHDCHGSPSELSCHSAMLLHDDCHSIDSPNMSLILENVKFPN
jgi:hypothetical protein